MDAHSDAHARRIEGGGTSSPAWQAWPGRPLPTPTRASRPAGWLSSQPALKAGAVCGTVAVDDWTPHVDKAGALRAHFAQT